MIVLPALAKIGASLLARVVAKKGSEYIKEKTGIDLEAVLEANDGEIPDEVAVELRQFEMEHEEELQRIALEVTKVHADVVTTVSAHAVTAHAADMKSDSWLSKNIRPLSLITVLSVVVLGLFVGFDAEKYEQVVGLCKEGFKYYFAGRSLEKISGGAVQRGAVSLYNKMRGKK